MTMGQLLAGVSLMLGALLLVEGLRQFLSGEETHEAARNRRMRMIRKGEHKEEEVMQLLKTEQRPKLGWAGKIQKTIKAAGSSMSFARFVTISVGVGVAISAVAASVLPNVLLAVVLGLVGAGLPLAVLHTLGQRRKQALEQQMPEALDRMQRGLQIGHPIAVTIESVARDMPDPIGSEFGLMFDQISYGDDVPSAFRSFADRVDIDDARYLAVSVGIQHGAGGNLGRILQILSDIIRDRSAMKKKIRAISSEGRLSATILTALPVFVFGAINFSAPDIYRNLAGTEYFWPLLGTIFGLILTQTLIIFKLVRFKF